MLLRLICERLGEMTGRGKRDPVANKHDESYPDQPVLDQKQRRCKSVEGTGYSSASHLIDDTNSPRKMTNPGKGSTQRVSERFACLLYDSMNLARITDSMCDSASVSRWLRHRFHAWNAPRRALCLRSRSAAVCRSVAVRYCDNDKL